MPEFAKNSLPSTLLARTHNAGECQSHARAESERMGDHCRWHSRISTMRNAYSSARADPRTRTLRPPTGKRFLESSRRTTTESDRVSSLAIVDGSLDRTELSDSTRHARVASRTGRDPNMNPCEIPNGSAKASSAERRDRIRSNSSQKSSGTKPPSKSAGSEGRLSGFDVSGVGAGAGGGGVASGRDRAGGLGGGAVSPSTR